MSDESLIVQQPSGPARQLVLLFHGLGADAHDLQPVAERLAAEYPDALVVSLRAPEPTDFGFGYQWISSAGLDDENRVERVAQAMPGFVATVRRWQRRARLGAEATVLIGFSQGAMMVLEATSHAAGATLAGRVVAISGRYARLPGLAPSGTTVFLLHGKADTVVDVAHTIGAAEHLARLGGDVVSDILPFAGHEVDDAMLDVAVRRLRTHVPRRHWEAAMRGVPPPGGGGEPVA